MQRYDHGVSSLLQGSGGFEPEVCATSHERLVLELRRYGRALAAGIGIAFVMLVAAPETPLTYPVAVGCFVTAGVLAWVDDCASTRTGFRRAPGDRR